MAKHSYQITINRIPASRDPIEYKFRQTKCTLTCAKDAACVRFEMGSKRTHEDVIAFRVDLAKDAMRKMYLLHALRYDSRLRVRSITVTIDGESKIYEQGYPGFPFLYSMLTARELGLPEVWHDREFLNAVLTATKSKSESDPRYACLFSFLAGTGRVYESEKFTCYWTAVNGHYNHLMDCYIARLFEKKGVSSMAELPKADRFKTGDRTSLGALVRILGCGQTVAGNGDRTTFKSEYGAVKSHLRGYDRQQLQELYAQLSAHRRDLGWVPEGPLGEHLTLCMERTGLSAWAFLLFDYGYYIRCNYLHGSKTPVLFAAATDPELAAFRALNIFLGEYLKEAIPGMFREDWFTEEMFEKIREGIKL